MQTRVVVAVCAFRDPEKGLLAERLRRPTTYVDGTFGHATAKLTGKRRSRWTVDRR